MLSTVLNSERAIRVNIEIMRAFVRLRQILASNAQLARRLDALEKKYDAQFKAVFDAIRQLMTPPEPNKRKIGFLAKERAARYGKRPNACRCHRAVNLEPATAFERWNHWNIWNRGQVDAGRG